jgi:hypothetical protein
MPVIPALGRLRQEDQDLEASLGYIERPHLEQNKIKQDTYLTNSLVPTALDWHPGWGDVGLAVP